MALSSAPNAPAVKIALATGLEEVVVYDWRLHKLFAAFMIHYSNTWHDGCEETLVERFEKSLEAEAAWQVHYSDLNQTANDASYQLQYKEFIKSEYASSFPPQHPSFFFHGKSIIHLLQKLKAWDEFKEFCEELINSYKHSTCTVYT